MSKDNEAVKTKSNIDRSSDKDKRWDVESNSCHAGPKTIK